MWWTVPTLRFVEQSHHALSQQSLRRQWIGENSYFDLPTVNLTAIRQPLFELPRPPRHQPMQYSRLASFKLPRRDGAFPFAMGTLS